MTVGRYVLIETAIAIVFSIVFNVGIGWLALHTLEPVPLMGLPGLAAGLVPATFMTCLMVTLAATLITRTRRRKGRAPMTDTRTTWLPHAALLRGLVVGLIATIIVTPLAVGALFLAFPGPYGLGEAIAINAVYAIVLAVLVAPPVLRTALGEAWR